MDFAKRQLEKYGWKEGSGLGKHSNGINVALKPALKFDNAGVGFNRSEEFTNNWWENIYNKAANNINVTTNNDSVHVQTKQGGFEICTKNPTAPTSTITSLGYKSFIKTSKLTENGIVDLDNKYKKIETNSIHVPCLTDEELFNACGGRTAHKGARHGLKLNGKLSRLEMQEKILLKKLNSVTLSDDKEKCNKKNIEKKLKKIEYHKNKNRSEDSMEVIPPTSPCILNNNSPHKGNKKRKSERKIVSFNDTVVEFHSQDCNETDNSNLELTSYEEAPPRPSTPVITIRKLKIEGREDVSGNNQNIDLDEGIDCTEFDTKGEGKCDLQEKIRNDNRRMKRKLKKLRNLNKPVITTTSSEDTDFTNNAERSGKWVKRKLFESMEIVNYKKTKWCDSDISYKSNKKKSLKKIRRQRKLEKSIDKVTNSFDNICKISNNNQE